AYDSMQTSTVANGRVAQANRTIGNWHIAAADWDALKRRAYDDWVRLSSRYVSRHFGQPSALASPRGRSGYLTQLFVGRRFSRVRNGLLELWHGENAWHPEL